MERKRQKGKVEKSNEYITMLENKHRGYEDKIFIKQIKINELLISYIKLNIYSYKHSCSCSTEKGIKYLLIVPSLL